MAGYAILLAAALLALAPSGCDERPAWVQSGGGAAATRAEQDQVIERALAEGNADAEAWLTDPTNKVLKGNQRKTLDFLQQVRRLGAKETSVINAVVEPEGEIASTFVIVLPQDPTARKAVFDSYRDFIGADGEQDPAVLDKLVAVDRGQEYLVLEYDRPIPIAAWMTLLIVLAMLIALAMNLAAADTIFVAGLTLLVTLGLFVPNMPTLTEALAGFSNQGLLTVAVLYIVVTGLTQTGAMNLISQPLLGRPKSVLTAQARLMLPAGFFSAFLNNTPIVAMLLPVVGDLCKKTGISPSKLFIPLSYATILGGVCTLIGTSTNLVVHGLLLDATDGQRGIGMFDITPVGVCCAVAGISFLLVTGRWLLPDRKAALSVGTDPRQYTVEMIVEPASPLVGQSIEKAGLRHLPGLYLAEIERQGEVLPAVSPREVLRAQDRLVFVGILESVVDLQKIRGLQPATNQVHKLDTPRDARSLIEAVVSDSCPNVGKSIREGRFRTTYDAAVLAVARNGERIHDRKIGDIVLRPGDTLLLEAHPSFVERQRNSRDFFLVSRVDGGSLPRHERAWIALLILAGMVLAAATGLLQILHAALLAAALMIATRCCTADEARRSIDWQVLIVIGAALGIGKAMLTTGVAGAIATSLLGAVGQPWVALAVLCAVTLLLTEVMSNNAAAALAFPIAMATADNLGVSYMPYVIGVMIAASCAFATPIGYQTNLMVYGPGGYRFTDYLRVGIPLNLVTLAVTVAVTPLVWPF